MKIVGKVGDDDVDVLGDARADLGRVVGVAGELGAETEEEIDDDNLVLSVDPSRNVCIVEGS